MGSICRFHILSVYMNDLYDNRSASISTFLTLLSTGASFALGLIFQLNRRRHSKLCTPRSFYVSGHGVYKHSCTVKITCLHQIRVVASDGNKPKRRLRPIPRCR